MTTTYTHCEDCGADRDPYGNLTHDADCVRLAEEERVGDWEIEDAKMEGRC